MPSDDVDDREVVQRLHRDMVAALPELEQLLRACSDHWGYEDPVYRLYHQSFKVYALQASTLKIVEQLRALAPAHCALANPGVAGERLPARGSWAPPTCPR